MSFYTGGRTFMRAVTRPFFKLTVEFAEPLPEGEGFVLACSHVSDWDPVMLGIACPKPVRYMAKSELFRIPVLGPVIRGLGAFPVERGKGDTGAIQNAVSIVREGGVLGIFPEGGRSRDGRLQKIKSGASVVAGQTGAGILPAAILYGKRRFFRRPVAVKFGQYIPREQLGLEAGYTKTELRAANRLLGERIAGLLEGGVP